MCVACVRVLCVVESVLLFVVVVVEVLLLLLFCSFKQTICLGNYNTGPQDNY